MFYFFTCNNLDAKIVTVLLLLITDTITKKDRFGGLTSICEARMEPRGQHIVSVTFSFSLIDLVVTERHVV